MRTGADARAAAAAAGEHQPDGIGYLYMFGRHGLPSGHGISFELAFAQLLE